MMLFPTVADWINVALPPPPYAYVLRRSFPRGLHVLVLVLKKDDGYQVLSAADNGTRQGTTVVEGSSRNAAETAETIQRACSKWEAKEATHPAIPNRPPVRYFYSTLGGGINGPATRDTLFTLATHGTLSWDAQLWEEVKGMTEGGRWRPLMLALGFPQKRRLISSAQY